MQQKVCDVTKRQAAHIPGGSKAVFNFFLIPDFRRSVCGKEKYGIMPNKDVKTLISTARRQHKENDLLKVFDTTVSKCFLTARNLRLQQKQMFQITVKALNNHLYRAPIVSRKLLL